MRPSALDERAAPGALGAEHGRRRDAPPAPSPADARSPGACASSRRTDAFMATATAAGAPVTLRSAGHDLYDGSFRCTLASCTLDLDPWSLFRALASKERPFFIDAGQPWGEEWVSSMGFRPRMQFRVTRRRPGRCAARASRRRVAALAPPARDRAPAAAGAVRGRRRRGARLREPRHAIERTPPAPGEAPDAPRLVAAVYDAALSYDHRRRSLDGSRAGISTTPALAALAEEIRDAAADAARRPSPIALPMRDARRSRPQPRCRHATPHASRASTEYIAAGDVYQVNLTQRFDTRLPAPAARRLRAPARDAAGARSAPTSISDRERVLSNSPELFLPAPRRARRDLPHQGHAPARRDARRRRARSPTELADDPEGACRARHDRRPRAERPRARLPDRQRRGRAAGGRDAPFATVQHLRLDGRRHAPRVGRRPATCLRATFPSGSITGAPKIRAMEIIAELEQAPRGFYTGALGWIDASGDCDLNVAIRTAVARGDRLTYHAGGGIVADSDAGARARRAPSQGGGVLPRPRRRRIRAHRRRRVRTRAERRAMSRRDLVLLPERPPGARRGDATISALDRGFVLRRRSLRDRPHVRRRAVRARRSTSRGWRARRASSASRSSRRPTHWLPRVRRVSPRQRSARRRTRPCGSRSPRGAGLRHRAAEDPASDRHDARDPGRPARPGARRRAASSICFFPFRLVTSTLPSHKTLHYLPAVLGKMIARRARRLGGGLPRRRRHGPRGNDEQRLRRRARPPGDAAAPRHPPRRHPARADDAREARRRPGRRAPPHPPRSSSPPTRCCSPRRRIEVLPGACASSARASATAAPGPVTRARSRSSTTATSRGPSPTKRAPLRRSQAAEKGPSASLLACTPEGGRSLAVPSEVRASSAMPPRSLPRASHLTLLSKPARGCLVRGWSGRFAPLSKPFITPPRARPTRSARAAHRRRPFRCGPRRADDVRAAGAGRGACRSACGSRLVTALRAVSARPCRVPPRPA